MTATLQAADISPQTLRKAAAAAALAAEKGQPVVYAGMRPRLLSRPVARARAAA